jgi:hypothetical protein
MVGPAADTTRPDPKPAVEEFGSLSRPAVASADWWADSVVPAGASGSGWG